MNVNGKMRPVETILGIRGEGIKENGGGVNLGMIYLVYCKKLCKCHSVSLPSTTIKFKKCCFYPSMLFRYSNHCDKIPDRNN
jgi:hypothetical protein